MAKEIFEAYIDKVIKAKRPIAGQRLIKAIKRHKQNIIQSKKKEYPYYFDKDESQKYINFIGLMRFVEGKVADQNFILEPFQQFIVAMIYGWREKETGKRRFNDVYIQMAKKNAKTTLSAALSLAQFYLDTEKGGQFYFAATTRDQANIAFGICKKIVAKLINEFEDIEQITQPYSQSILRTDTQAFIRSISKEANNIEGKGAYFALLDEYHLHKNDDVVNNIKSGQALAYSNNPLLIRITTAGNSIGGPCHRFYQQCNKILDGIISDDRILVIICDLDDGDDWKKESNWVKANPNLGQSPEKPFLRDQVKQAINLGGRKEIDVRTKHFNTWVSTASTWIGDDIYMKGANPQYDYKDFKGSKINVGLDLASSKDIASLVFTIERDGNIYVFPYFFCPEAKIQAKNEFVDYAKFWMEGYLIVCGEDMLDYDAIEGVLLQINKDFKINNIYYDNWNSSQFIFNLEKKAMLPIKSLSQTPATLSPATKKLADKIHSGKFFHNGNPVLRWMFSNVAIKERGDAIQVSKDKSGGKIDGVAATIFAIAGNMFEEKKEPARAFIMSISTND